MRELFSLTHHFIVKNYTYHQGNMFQLRGAIIRRLYKNRSLSGFWCTIGIQIVYITEVLLIVNLSFIAYFRKILQLLTLRRLMSYIYMEHPFLMFLDHTQRRSTVDRTPLDE